LNARIAGAITTIGVALLAMLALATQASPAPANDEIANGAGPFQLEIQTVSRPANDNLAGATTIAPDLPIAVDGSNADATIEKGESRPDFWNGPIATVWYRWDSPITGPVDISTCGSASEVFAAVHVGTPFPRCSWSPRRKPKRRNPNRAPIRTRRMDAPAAG
jgi:hypothetical protein